MIPLCDEVLAEFEWPMQEMNIMEAKTTKDGHEWNVEFPFL
jgi:hypothetical protein